MSKRTIATFLSHFDSQQEKPIFIFERRCIPCTVDFPLNNPGNVRHFPRKLIISPFKNYSTIRQLCFACFYHLGLLPFANKTCSTPETGPSSARGRLLSFDASTRLFLTDFTICFCFNTISAFYSLCGQFHNSFDQVFVF